MPQLREDALGLADLLVAAAQEHLVAAARQLLHAQGAADLAQVLVPAAEQQQGFVSIIQGYGRFAHAQQFNPNVGLRLTSA